jgi:predicted amidohydrolase
MSAVTVALVQLDVSGTESVPDRVVRTLGLVREAARTANLVVLPELWHVGAFDLSGAREHAEPIDGPLVTALREMAATTGTWLHGGSFAELAPDGRRYNTAVLIGPDGSLVAAYRKIHLFGFAEGERTVMTAGDDLVVVPTPLGDTGLATCYDLRFPEQFRGLTEAGASVFLLCSGWPDTRIEHWSVLARARAIEDQAWVVACNEVGTHAGVRLGGHSIVVDPMGRVVAEGGSDEEIVVATIDTTVPQAWRRDFPVLPDRRL